MIYLITLVYFYIQVFYFVAQSLQACFQYVIVLCSLLISRARSSVSVQRENCMRYSAFDSLFLLQRLRWAIILKKHTNPQEMWLCGCIKSNCTMFLMEKTLSYLVLVYLFTCAHGY